MAEEKILIIDDESAICELIQMNLEAGGYSNIKTANDGANAVKTIFEWLPDLILLDLMLPQIDGLSICKQVKNTPQTANIPIIILSAKSRENDIVEGLEAGANDYITKPFSNKILLARIKSQLRNTSNASFDIINYKNLSINFEQRNVKISGITVDLTYSEFEILSIFARHPGKVYTRSQLLALLRGDDGFDIAERAIDVQIVNLRKKLGEYGKYIETIRGIGYRVKEVQDDQTR